ncbi:Uncharacterised protein (plasmid) [Klebsiella aerogenes]|nr:Uncharacterised protein [Klebsiella aerogenes]
MPDNTSTGMLTVSIINITDIAIEQMPNINGIPSLRRRGIQGDKKTSAYCAYDNCNTIYIWANNHANISKYPRLLQA